MNYTVHQNQIRTLRQDDPRFIIKDKFVVSPRAGFEFSQDCPRTHKLMIMEAIKNEWLMPIANITERELIFMGLTNES
jgi:hypothetical protein